jgi:Tfp pilus assembly protein PilF
MILFAVLFVGMSIYAVVTKGPYGQFLWAAVGLVVVAAVGPETIKRFAFGKDGLQIERHQPSPEEQDLAIAASADTVPDEMEQQAEKLATEASRRSEQERSAEDYLMLATQEWRAKRYDAALQNAYSGLLVASPGTRTHATLLHRAGSAYHYMGQHQYGEAHYRKAIAADPRFSLPHNNLGLLLSNTGRNEEAEREYREAIRLDPENAMAHNNLGVLLGDTGRKEEAKRAFAEAKRLRDKAPQDRSE